MQFFKKKPNMPIPTKWTPELWAELSRSQNEFSCFIGVDRYCVTTDFQYGVEKLEAKREFGAAVFGAPETSLVRGLRATLSFKPRAESSSTYLLPEHCSGYAFTSEMLPEYAAPAKLHFHVFAEAQTEQLFDELFVRAKLLKEPFVPVHFRLKVVQIPPSDSSRFTKLVAIERAWFTQDLSLLRSIPHDHPAYGNVS